MTKTRNGRAPACVLALLASAPLFAGCATGGAARQFAVAPKLEREGETKCKIAASQAEPLIVEWPSTARGKLEALSKQGLVAVRYSGCEMEVLAACRVTGSYGYTPITAKHDRVSVHDADELYSKIPLGAANLEGTLQRAGQLDVSMTIVGRFASDRVEFNELAGPDCGRATHVVSALTMGAFEFSAGADASVGGSASLLNAGGGAKSHSSRELLNSDGNEASCSAATSGDAKPPDGCGGIVRIEVIPINANAKVQVSSSMAPPPSPTDTSQEPQTTPPMEQPGLPAWATPAMRAMTGMGGVALTIETEEDGKSYHVEIESNDGTHACEANVTTSSPCTLTVPMGPSRIHVTGDGDRTSDFAVVPNSKTKLKIVHHGRSAAWIFAGLAVGGGIAAVVGYSNAFTSTYDPQLMTSTPSTDMGAIILASVGLSAAVVGLYGIYYALKIPSETISVDRLGMPSQQIKSAPLTLVGVSASPTTFGHGGTMDALFRF